jgi:hypothetical protein
MIEYRRSSQATQPALHGSGLPWPKGPRHDGATQWVGPLSPEHLANLVQHPALLTRVKSRSMTLLSAPEVIERIGQVLGDVDPPVQEGDLVDDFVRRVH